MLGSCSFSPLTKSTAQQLAPERWSNVVPLRDGPCKASLHSSSEETIRISDRGSPMFGCVRAKAGNTASWSDTKPHATEVGCMTTSPAFALY